MQNQSSFGTSKSKEREGKKSLLRAIYSAVRIRMVIGCVTVDFALATFHHIYLEIKVCRRIAKVSQLLPCFSLPHRDSEGGEGVKRKSRQ